MVFGMGNVLYDATLWRRWLLRVLRRLGLCTSYRPFFHIWDREYLAEVRRGRRDFGEALRSFLLAAGLSPGQIQEVEAACEARRRHWEAEARLLTGVRTTLERLHAAGFVLAVATDSEYPAAVLRRRLDSLGLTGLFTTVVSSVDVGQTMPHPLPYLTALRHMRISPPQAAFVGHSACELAGASSLGMMTVAFNYEPEIEADAYAATFTDLLELTGVQTRYAEAG